MKKVFAFATLVALGLTIASCGQYVCPTYSNMEVPTSPEVSTV